MLGKSSKDILPNGGLMVIYQGKKHKNHLKQAAKLTGCNSGIAFLHVLPTVLVAAYLKKI